MIKLTSYFSKFFRSSQSSSVILILCVMFSLMIANSSFGIYFKNLLHYKAGISTISLYFPIEVWINDGFMSIFFLLVGLEIKREFLDGELSTFKSAALPVVAAIGGMLVPAILFTALNFGTPYAAGWAIPMATDIAFSLAVLAMLHKKIPPALKVFLAALAITDDLGAILIIAIFYTEKIHLMYLLFSCGIFLFLVALNYFKVRNLVVYIIPGIFLWFCMHHSGIHATVAGVLLAFCIPANGQEESPLENLEHKLSNPVNYFIMPLFAFANTNIIMHSGMVDGLFSNFGLGIIAGLFLGKMLGINIFSYIFIKLKICRLPDKTNWQQMLGAGFLAGIGFTMSVFIAMLSFKNSTELQDEAKFAILVASILSGFTGYFILKRGKQTHYYRHRFIKSNR